MATAASSNTGLTLVSAGSYTHLFNADGVLVTSVDVLPISQTVPLSKNQDGTDKKEQTKFHDNFQVLATSFSNSGKLAAVATSAKTVVVFNYDSDKLSTLRVFRIPKTPTALIFDRADAFIVVADRAGVVRKYSVQSTSKENKQCIDEDDADETDFEGDFICSAISMMLDVAFTQCGRFLLVSDRDEKLRVHRYPQTFVLHSLCLGHKDYVASIQTTTVGDKTIAISGGGDASLLAWDIETGTEIGRLDSVGGAIRKIVVLEEGVRIAVLLNNSTSLIIYRLEMNNNSITFVEEKKIDVEGAGRIMDVTVISSHKIAVVSTSGIGQLSIDDGSIKWAELGDEHKKTLAEAKDPIGDLSKKVAFDNMNDYLQRKNKKIEEYKNAKRRKTANGDSIAEPPTKKAEEEVTVEE